MRIKTLTYTFSLFCIIGILGSIVTIQPGEMVQRKYTKEDPISTIPIELPVENIPLSDRTNRNPDTNFLGEWYDDFEDMGKIQQAYGLSINQGQVNTDQWKYYRAINIYNPGTGLEDSQVLLVLNQSNLDGNHTLEGGGDVRFYYANGENINYWIEEWNSTGTKKIWLNLTVMEGNNSIVMEYGNPWAGIESSGEAVFDFFDDFSVSPIDQTRWDIVDNYGWSVENGTLSGTNTNGRLLSRRSFSYPVVQETKVRITQKPPNGFQVAGFYLSRNNGFGYLSAINNAWVRNENRWVNLAGKYIGLDQWHRATISSSTSALVNLDITNLITGVQTYENNFTNQVSGERIALGKRADNWGPGQTYQAHWDHIFCRKYLEREPELVAGEVTTRALPHMVSETINLPRHMANYTLLVEKDEPGNSSISLSIIDATTNLTIPEFDTLKDSSINLTSLDRMNISIIRLRTEFHNTQTDSPVLRGLNIGWYASSPLLTKLIPDVEVFEDTPQENMINMTEHFYDIYSKEIPSNISMKGELDTSNITLQMIDQYLGVVFLAENFSGEINLTICYTNGWGLSVNSNYFTIDVVAVNDAPVWSLLPPSIEMLEGKEFAYNNSIYHYVTDAEGDELSFDLYSPDAELDFYIDSYMGIQHTLVVIPHEDLYGNISFLLTVYESDAPEFNSTIVIKMKIYPVNDAPRVKDDIHIILYEDTSVSMALDDFFVDPDDKILYYSVQCDTENLSLEVGDNGTLVIVPRPHWWGEAYADIIALDLGGNMNITRLAILVKGVNDVPRAFIEGTKTHLQCGEDIRILGGGSDIDGTISNYSWYSSLDGYLGNNSVLEFEPFATLSTGIHTFFLSVQDDMGEWSPNFTKIMRVVGPELELTDVKVVPGEYSNGNNVEIWTSLVNLGDGYARDVIISILVDGMEVKRLLLPHVLSGEKRVLKVPFDMVEGTHTIKVQFVDLEQESLYRGNGLVETRFVLSSEINVMGVIIPLLLLAGTIIVLIIPFLMKRKIKKMAISRLLESAERYSRRGVATEEVENYINALSSEFL